MDDISIVDIKYPPVLLIFSLEPGDMTLVSLTTLSYGRMKFIATEGKIVDFPPIPAISKPHFKFAPDDLSEFLTKFSMGRRIAPSGACIWSPVWHDQQNCRHLGDRLRYYMRCFDDKIFVDVLEIKFYNIF